MRDWLLAASIALALTTAHAQETPPPDAGAPPPSQPSDQPPPGNQPPRPDITNDTAPPTAPPPEVGTVPVAEQAPPALPGPQAENPNQLEDIVVTAQKTKQPLRKVPMSLTNLGGEFIQQTGVPDLAGLALYVPNARVDAHDPGSPQVFIRGFGTNSFNPSFESSVALVQDDVYFGRPGYFTESMFDVDRVEVLRGPQGTLFGKNTVAGVFNVITKSPEDTWSQDLRYTSGEHQENRVEGGVGGPLGEWGGVRVSALYNTTNGQLFNQLLDRSEEKLDQKAARLKFALFPLSKAPTEFTVVTSGTRAPFWPFQLKNLDSDTRTYLQGFDPKIEDDPYNFVTSMNLPGWINKGSNTGSSKTTWEMGDVGPLQGLTSVLVLAGSKFHIDQLNEIDVSPADISNLDSHEDHKQLSAELRFTAQADSLFGIGTGLQFVAGGFYFHSDYTLFARVLAGKDLGSYIQTRDFCQLATGDPSATPGGGGTCVSTSPGVPVFGTVTAPATNSDWYQFDYTQSIESEALFGQMTWNLTESWALTPGVRMNLEKKGVNAEGAGHCPGKSSGQPCFMEQLLQANDYNEPGLTRDETDVSPKLALQYYGGAINYYASYAQGYKSGGFNAISFTGDKPADPTMGTPAQTLEYEPERARTYELGAKAKFFDNKLAANLTLYQTEFQNLQVLAFAGLFFTVKNAATAQSRGLEGNFQWIPPYEPLRVIGSFGLLDAKYKSYPVAPAPIYDGIGASQDLSGKRLAFAPSNTGTLTPTLSYLFMGYLASFAVDWLHQGDQYTDVDLDRNVHVNAYDKFNARLTLTPAGGWWGVQLAGNNLMDKRVLNQVTDAPFFPGTYFAQQAQGRQLFAALSMQI